MEKLQETRSSSSPKLMHGGRRRVLLFPLPLQGHLNPMLQLANILYTKGFSITIIHTLFNSPKSDNYPHFTFKPIAICRKSDGSGTNPNGLNFLNEGCEKTFRDCLAELLEQEEEEPIACLITDSNWYITQAVADGFKLPRIVLRTNSLVSSLVYTALPLFLEKGYFHQDSKSEAPVPEFPVLKMQDIPKLTSDPEVFCSYVSTVVEANKAASAIIWNSFKELEETVIDAIFKEYPIPNFPIGPLHKHSPAFSTSLLEHDRSFMPWLDLQAPNSVIYICFGSMIHSKEAEIKEMAQGLANSKQPFLWTVRPRSVNDLEWLEILPDGFLEEVSGRGHFIKWAPQEEVLAHPSIGCFWTHNGWNSTLESICEGVPMICSPYSVDQPINSRYVQDVWQIGVYLENGFKSEEIETAIKRVMVDEEGKEMRERINALKKKAKLCLEQGGSSYQSLDSLVDYILSL